MFIMRFMRCVNFEKPMHSIDFYIERMGSSGYFC